MAFDCEGQPRFYGARVDPLSQVEWQSTSNQIDPEQRVLAISNERYTLVFVANMLENAVSEPIN
jgi:hypothetical protein